MIRRTFTALALASALCACQDATAETSNCDGIQINNDHPSTHAIREHLVAICKMTPIRALPDRLPPLQACQVHAADLLDNLTKAAQRPEVLEAYQAAMPTDATPLEVTAMTQIMRAQVYRGFAAMCDGYKAQ